MKKRLFQCQALSTEAGLNIKEAIFSQTRRYGGVAGTFFLLTAVLFGGSGCGGGGTEQQKNDFLDKAAAMYQTKPNLATCSTGVLTEAEKQKVLVTLNAIRHLHGLANVVYDTASDDQVMQASLMFAANGEISHTPPTTWKCYSATGAAGAGVSNITGGPPYPNLTFETVDENVIGWVTDVRNLLPNNIGHRRWMLDPFLKQVAYGRVAAAFDSSTVVDGSAIKVIYGNDVNGTATSGYVAYPVNDYPSQFFASNALLSFSAVPSVENRQANFAVDYSAAVVTVTQRGGNALTVRNLAYDNIGYGVPNSIQFTADGMAQGIVYDVSIRGVRINAASRDFAYWFRIV
jgi:uncharacterized protein YkwD